jgi:hypothetical protein
MIAHYILNAFKSVILDFLNLGVVRVGREQKKLSAVVYSMYSIWCCCTLYTQYCVRTSTVLECCMRYSIRTV